MHFRAAHGDVWTLTDLAYTSLLAYRSKRYLQWAVQYPPPCKDEPSEKGRRAYSIFQTRLT
eukprot:5925172-Pleurochrysis_carterae.AAC.3